MTSQLKNTRLLKKQPPMRKVLTGLLPCVCGAIYFFGWRSLAVIGVSCLAGFLTEFIFCRKRGEPVSEAVFVTAVLFALVMPPTVGFHVVVVGVVFAVLFGKEVFGGFGRNIFNPAIAGRAFVYVCFPVALTATWAPPAQERWGALDRWSTYSNQEAITGATPMAHLKAGVIVPVGDKEASGIIPEKIETKHTYEIYKPMLMRALAFGRISGTMGVTSAILILIGGMYLFFAGVASRTIIISIVLAYAVFNMVFTLLGFPNFYGASLPVLGGGFLLGAFFMATDPVSSPKTEPGKIIYGIIIALGTVVIRNFSIFNGGLMFSIILGNMFAPIIDYAVNSLKHRQAESLH